MKIVFQDYWIKNGIDIIACSRTALVRIDLDSGHFLFYASPDIFSISPKEEMKEIRNYVSKMGFEESFSNEQFSKEDCFRLQLSMTDGIYTVEFEEKDTQ